jgi:hypothetical protein
MNTDRAAAIRAYPSDVFVRHEFPDPEVANVFQVLDHAHVVTGPVAFIQALQASTGELLTLKAKSRFCILEALAVFDPAMNTIVRFVDIDSSAAGTLVFVSQISQTNAAVHSAGRDEGCLR